MDLPRSYIFGRQVITLFNKGFCGDPIHWLDGPRSELLCAT
jgi:hypothetical protein